jgi:hypothetical protein
MEELADRVVDNGIPDTQAQPLLNLLQPMTVFLHTLILDSAVQEALVVLYNRMGRAVVVLEVVEEVTMLYLVQLVGLVNNILSQEHQLITLEVEVALPGRVRADILSMPVA